MTAPCDKSPVPVRDTWLMDGDTLQYTVQDASHRGWVDLTGPDIHDHVHLPASAGGELRMSTAICPDPARHVTWSRTRRWRIRLQRALFGAFVLSALALVPARAGTPAAFPLTVSVTCPGVSPLNVANRNYADGYVVLVDGGKPGQPLVVRWDEQTFTVLLGQDGGQALWSRVSWTQDGLALATLGSAWYQVPVSQCTNAPRAWRAR